ncbi:CHC2 zinc finger domain-containing protein [Albimonas sp. CAU 1670]|uniref:CHC2 zinc finger domain-containing protein n=1 Tax=Albimonas sp. CAU 1670 TaxID=3032599 RepID=UPI0023DAD6A0|nr:CHC2 zinc finger domain-containing protein [Albimonas sp. CAU 1670]MDF2233154.1 CHC2 zinc finger domain-containing protein [Albimonas sp. CAU 1670]
MAYVDFAELKSRLSIADAADLLGLKMIERNGQRRGPCPACRKGGPRALVVTPAKGVFYCFGARTGGDMISLAAHVQDCGLKEAAAFLAGDSGTVPGDSTSSRNGPQEQVPEERRRGNGERRLLKPLEHLQPAHPKVLALGLTEETCRAFGAGYAPKGVLRGRLAIPIHDWAGELVAYCGRAVGGESPELIFPNGFRPEAHFFNAHQVGKGEILLCRDPLEAMLAAQNGIENVAAPLTEGLAAEQLHAIAALMDERGCDAVHVH